MSKIDLRLWLNQKLVANSNAPVDGEAPPPANDDVAGRPRDAPPRGHVRRAPPAGAPPIHMHRALRPRRRT